MTFLAEGPRDPGTRPLLINANPVRASLVHDARPLARPLQLPGRYRNNEDAMHENWDGREQMAAIGPESRRCTSPSRSWEQMRNSWCLHPLLLAPLRDPSPEDQGLQFIFVRVILAGFHAGIHGYTNFGFVTCTL